MAGLREAQMTGSGSAAGPGRALGRQEARMILQNLLNELAAGRTA
jgi:hypothetical protein